MKRRSLLLLAFLCWTNALFGASYHALFFSYEGANKNLPRKSHTFATFVKVEQRRASFDVESVTISWGPSNQKVRALRRRAQEGVNSSLISTVNDALRTGFLLDSWGPYEISKEIYDRAVIQEGRLKAGKIGYKVLDEKFRPFALNCIHAVSDIFGHLETGTLRGSDATKKVVNTFKQTRQLGARNTAPLDLFSALDIENVRFRKHDR
ncbi:MAG: hypothetical protein R3B54_09670 [Bdellovibrionota bacterium]